MDEEKYKEWEDANKKLNQEYKRDMQTVRRVKGYSRGEKKHLIDQLQKGHWAIFWRLRKRILGR